MMKVLVFILLLNPILTHAGQVEVGSHCQTSCGCAPCGCASVRCDQQQEDVFANRGNATDEKVVNPANEAQKAQDSI